MLSNIPFKLENVSKEDLDNEILRVGVIAELDAINLYEQLASITKDSSLKKVFLDIAKEEKTHVGEFLTLLLMKDKEGEKEFKNGKEEVKELLEKK
ncbi:MAG TPA: ferritin family protein [Caldisericia bacterium]|nr:rubrerythrin [bacterium]HOL83473.1 ferritin family protein [Caldisericia bacterium]HPP43932.1 ferritin family protein [Caldisericia bacterium]HQJ56395.1 ferritin family protein [Caldisericia bacterium]